MGGTTSSAACRAAVMALLGLLLTAGCTVTVNGDVNPDKTPHPTAPVGDDGVEEWDLRTPPSASDVGMRGDKDHVAYETRKPRRVRLLLPKGRVLETEVYLLIFDRIRTKDPVDPTRPTGMDFDTTSMPLATAYKVMGDGLEAFGLDRSPVEEWRSKIERRPTSGPSADQGIKGGANTRVGYLTIGVGGEFDPVDQDGSASITYHVNF